MERSSIRMKGPNSIAVAGPPAFERRVDPMVDLHGKIALVTGASRGIGRAIAIALARCGANVAVNYRTQKKEAQITLQRITSQGRRAMEVQADVSRSPEVAHMIAGIEKDLGPVDIL